jgi:hypothetical protein
LVQSNAQAGGRFGVVRAAGIHTSQLFRWRQQLCERSQVPAAFNPVAITPENPLPHPCIGIPVASSEAATRPTRRFVALKSEEQLDMQTLHRARDQAVRERTSLMNQLRAVLLERGVVVPQGRAKLRLRVTELLRQATEELSARIRLLIEDMLTRWQALDERIAVFDTEFAAEAKQNEAARRLTPGHHSTWQ